MKLVVKKVSKVKAININGKVMEREEHYCIYRSVLCGLLHMYVDFSSLVDFAILPDILHADKVRITYCRKKNSRWFQTRSEAEAVVNDMKHNPDKYIMKV